MSNHTVTQSRRVSFDATNNPKEKQLHEVTFSLAQEIKSKQTTTAGLDNIPRSEKNTLEENSHQENHQPLTSAQLRLWTQINALVAQLKTTTQQIKIAVDKSQDK